MAYLKDVLTDLNQALSRWEEALKEPFSELVRDATIQRFEFSFERLWKVAKVFLKEAEGVDCASPKSCFRQLRNTLKLTDEEVEQLLIMVDDRNDSVHLYSEKMADELYRDLKKYARLTRKVYKQITQNFANQNP